MMKVIKIYVTVTLSYNYLRHFTSVCFFFIWFKFALYLILDNLSCYAIVFRTRVTCSFSKQFAYSTRSVESLRPAAFARCNFAVACGRISTRMRRAMRCDATGHVAAHQLNRSETNSPSHVRFHFPQTPELVVFTCQFRAFDSAVTAGEATATVGAEGIIGLSRIRSWAGSFGAKPDRLTQLGFITGSAASLPANICNT